MNVPVTMNDTMAWRIEYEKSLNDVDWIDEIGRSINITRAYTNPMNAIIGLTAIAEKNPEVIGLTDDALMPVRQSVSLIKTIGILI